VPVALSIIGAFAIGLAVRRRLQHHFAAAFRANAALGMGTVGLLSGWSFSGDAGGLTALGVLLAAQVTAVLVAARLFGPRPDGPVLAYGLYGNPGFWSVPVTAATLGTRPAVVVATYDLVTQPRIALGVRLMRARAPAAPRARTAATDYAPTAAAVTGLLLGRITQAPPVIPDAVVVLSTALSVVGAVLIGLAWPAGGWGGVADVRRAAPALALHLTFVPSVLVAAALAGVAVPAGAWVLALGPLPISMLSFARLYGYSARLAATALAWSMAVGVALLPLAVWLARHGPAS
jgi:hypothetical protein